MSRACAGAIEERQCVQGVPLALIRLLTIPRPLWRGIAIQEEKGGSDAALDRCSESQYSLTIDVDCQWRSRKA